jgi:hypothetical protein
VTVGDIPDDERPAPEPSATWRGRDFEESIRRGLAQGVGLDEIAAAAADVASRLAAANGARPLA